METVAIRFKEGPLDGKTIQREMEWPPPDWIVLEAVDGFYKKVRQSGLTDQQMEGLTHVVRGAEYTFLTDEQVGFNPEEVSDERTN